MATLANQIRGRRTKDGASAEEKLYVASQWQLMWLKFRRHRLAMVGTVTVGVMYIVAIFNGFFAPYDSQERLSYPHAPYHGIHFFDEGTFRPHVYGLKVKTDFATLVRSYSEDTSTKIPVNFFVRGSQYEILGIFKADIHLFGAEKGGYIFLLGTDALGRDLFSRILNGSVISLSIGLVGVFISFVLGSLLGGFSGYYGGAFDFALQRLIEFLISIPAIPLWLALAAAVPKDWSSVQIYFAVTIILSLQGWCSMARVVRGKLLQLREEDFVLEARLGGASDWRIVIVHMLPAFMSYLIVQITLAIPQMVLGETMLSFLGLGLQPPVVSWGVLLQDARNIQAASLYPWLLMPAVFVVVTVLAFNFMGDGLRDAADPYKS